VELTENSWQ